MKKVFIYSETLLLLKGIDQLLKEGIAGIQTEQVYKMDSLKECLHSYISDLFILHLDFTIDSPEYLVKQLTETAIQAPLLILTDDITTAQNLFIDNVKEIQFLDIRNTVTKITQAVVNMLGTDESEILSHD
jgi:hypothetical protein